METRASQITHQAGLMVVSLFSTGALCLRHPLSGLSQLVSFDLNPLKLSSNLTISILAHIHLSLFQTSTIQYTVVVEIK